MPIQTEAPVQLTQVNEEAYLSRLPQEDRIHLQQIGQQFQKVMEGEGRKGALVVVGGTLNKPLPRKDIDILMVLQPHPTDAQRGSSTELDFALADFKTFQRIVKDITDQNPALQIHKVVEPAMDEEFNSPSILKHDGSITVTNIEKNTTPIEFVRIRDRGSYQKIMSGTNRPFVILKEV